MTHIPETEAPGVDGHLSRLLSRGRLYVTRGAAPALLFVHGGFHGAWCWSQVMAYLAARGIGAAAVDLRGHGGLAQDGGFITQGTGDLAGDVIEAARHLPKGIVLAGHSLGALIVMRAAQRIAPRGLILLAPAAPADLRAGPPLPPFPAERAVPPPGAARARKWFLSGTGGMDVADYLARLCPESPRLLNECFHAGVVIDPDEITCPVLCISGGRDDSPFHPAGQDQAIAKRYGAELRVIPEAGHCLMLDEGRRQTAKAICDWMKEKVPS